MKDGNVFRLSVSNDGPVVPPEKRSVIFTQFYRHTNADGQAGTGIGLYLSKSLAELQNGKLGMTDDSNTNEFVLRPRKILLKPRKHNRAAKDTRLFLRRMV